jgi:hypothetical protein
MTLVFSIAVGIVGVIVLFLCLNWASRATDKTTATDVRQILEGFLVGSLGRWDWDDFLSVSIKDPRLDEIARHCGRLPEEFPPEKPGHYCGSGGFEVIRGYIEELRALEVEQSSRGVGSRTTTR